MQPYVGPYQPYGGAPWQGSPYQPYQPALPYQPNQLPYQPNQWDPRYGPGSSSPYVPAPFGAGAVDGPGRVYRSTFSNPTFGFDAPDPSILRAADGYFYAHTTQANNAHFPVLRSRDLTSWQVVGDAMPHTPRWVKEIPGNRAASDMWAPQVVRTGSFYTMFYSARGKDNLMHIGVATATTPAGPFIDSGRPLDFTQGPNNTTIDPNVLVTQDGRAFLYWGSAHGGAEPGLYAQQIVVRADGSVQPVGPKTIAKPKLPSDRVLVEAPWVVERNGRYYMFYSDGDFRGKTPNDEYALKVAVASSPLGPFSEGRRVISANERFRGPGHATLVTDDAGQDWVVYHARDRETQGARRLMMDRLDWGPDGWPVVNAGRGPSSGPQVGPVIA